MAYDIVYKKSVHRDLKKLSKPEAKRILDLIEQELIKQPESNPVLKGRFAELRKYRVGDYRADSKITPGFVRRSIPPCGVARQLNTSMYSPSSRLAGRAPRRTRSWELIFESAHRVIYALLGLDILILRIGNRKDVYKGDT